MVKKACVTEHIECVMFATLLKTCPLVVKYSKIPMEIWTPSINQIRKHKKEGMNKGIFDYELIVKDKKGKKHFVKIEMKRKRGGVVSKEQKEWLAEYLECGIHATVSKGALEAWKFVEDIIEGNI